VKHAVFIQANHKQYLGALVAAHALKRNSAHPEGFDVRIMEMRDFPFFREREGQIYLRDGAKRQWLNDDLQSFTPTRFLPPELMGYQGRAVVIDPDVFAVGDIAELLNRDMEGKAIMRRPRSGTKQLRGCLASSVMLLDCAKLTHWKVEQQFNEMFEFERDYMDWVCLKLEPRESIGFFEHEWNDFDKLTPKTKMLHTTKRKTQPWKSGLPVDYRPPERHGLLAFTGWIQYARRQLFGEYGLLGHYRDHPDKNQELFFFGLLKECLDNGTVTEEMLREEMRQSHVRHDAFEVLDRTPPLSSLSVLRSNHGVAARGA
jgi:hypothetical protein